MKTILSRTFVRILSLTSFIICVILTVWGFKSGVFTSQSLMEEKVAEFGVLGSVLFVLIQIVQVVIPILPGGVSCLAGVLLFGAIKGFLYNYIGICIGSLLAFSLAKSYGRPILPNACVLNMCILHSFKCKNFVVKGFKSRPHLFGNNPV